MRSGIVNRIAFIGQHRQRRIVEGSQVFTGSNTGAIAAAGTYGIDFESQSKWKKHLPFDCFELVNESDNTLDLIFNDGEPMRIPAFGVKGLADISIWRFRIVNNGADAIPIGEVSYTTFKSAESERVKRQPVAGTEFER